MRTARRVGRPGAPMLLLLALAAGCDKPAKPAPSAPASAPEAPAKPVAPPEADAAPPGFSVLFALKDGTGRPLGRVTLAAFDPSDRIYVLEDDGDLKALHQFAPDGSHLRTWDDLVYGVNRYDFFFPMSVDVDASGRLLLCDAGFYWVQRFDPAGGAELYIAGRAMPESGILTPGRAAFDASGYVYVTQGESTKVHVFAPDGKALPVVETAQETLKAHTGIAAVAVGPDGRRHVLSTSGQLLTFDADWKFLRSVEARDCSMVDVGPDGRVVVAHAGSVLLYDAEGKEVSRWMASDDAPEFGATAVALDSKGRLVLIEQRMDFNTAKFSAPRVLTPK